MGTAALRNFGRKTVQGIDDHGSHGWHGYEDKPDMFFIRDIRCHLWSDSLFAVLAVQELRFGVAVSRHDWRGGRPHAAILKNPLRVC